MRAARRRSGPWRWRSASASTTSIATLFCLSVCAPVTSDQGIVRLATSIPSGESTNEGCLEMRLRAPAGPTASHRAPQAQAKGLDGYDGEEKERESVHGFDGVGTQNLTEPEQQNRYNDA